MDLPVRLFCEYLTGFCVCYFKDRVFSPEAPPHYYIVVPVSDASSLLLCIITSQVEKRRQYYRENPAALSSLVRVNRDSFPFLKKESLIDCNRPELIQRHKLAERIDPNVKYEVITRDIPDHLKREIVLAIKRSPVVKNYIKNVIVSV